MATIPKPDMQAVRHPQLLLRVLLGLYSQLAKSGVLLDKPTLETATDELSLLYCLIKFYGAAFILGARDLPRPSSKTVASPDQLLTWLVKLYDAAVA